MYTFICLLFIGSGGLLLFLFPYTEHPGKAVIAIVLIVLGLFFLCFRGKGAGQVKDAVDTVNDSAGIWPPW